MTVAPIALTWALAAAVAATALPRLRRRRLGALVPLAAAVAALATLGWLGGPDLSPVLNQGGLQLGRPAAGLCLLISLSVTVAWVLSPPADSVEVVVVGLIAALAAVSVATGAAVLWGASLLAAWALLATWWLTAAPARSTLSAARTGGVAAGALLGASAFLPVDEASATAQAHVVGGLLAVGVGAALALLPLAGWVGGSGKVLRGGALGPWVLVLVPAVVLVAEAVPGGLPAAARGAFDTVLLPAGAVSTGWAAVMALLAPDRERYLRLFVADLAMVGMGLAAQQPAAQVGGLLIVLTHLCTGPLLLQDPAAALTRPRRLAWIALSGVPPSPAFWARFSLVAGLVQAFGGVLLLVLLPAVGALLAVALRAVASAAHGERGSVGRVVRLAAWLPPLAALTVGMLPAISLRALLGLG